MENIFFNNLTWSIGIIIGLFGIIAAHRLVSYRDKKNIFNAAAKEFSEAFIRVRDLLEIKPPTDPAVGNEWQKTYRLLKSFYNDHRAAVRKFEDSLPLKERTSFRECWNTYCCYDKQNNIGTFSDYQSEPMEEELQKRHLATSRIEALLKYTQIK